MNILKEFNPIKVFVFDVDGVLTDGRLLVMPNNLMARSLNVKDGYALQLAIKKGYHILIISGGNSREVAERLVNLGVSEVQMNIKDKIGVLREYLALHTMQPNQVLYMGDDMPDYTVMQYCGMPCCPKDAVQEIKSISKYISPKKGGKGCVRDVIEKVMRLHGHWTIDTHIPSR